MSKIGQVSLVKKFLVFVACSVQRKYNVKISRGQ